MSNAVPRRRVVLVVEDEYFLRLNAVLMIEDAGFDVLEAANADQAIEILEDRPDVHVVFTEYKSPGPWTASNSLTRCGGDGRRSKSSRPPDTPVISQTPISHQRAGESRPAGLMGSAKALAGIAMKILVEDQ